MGVRQKHEDAQMTVELAVVFPVLLLIAVIATNALLFFSECAAFDNAFREAVRISATSPAYGQTVEDSSLMIERKLQDSFNKDFQSVTVLVEGVSLGHSRFTGTLRCNPTLFGIGLKSSFFGVALPSVSHSVSLTVDGYKPGVFI